jgi:nucleoside-diphosphate-sugar epimerase
VAAVTKPPLQRIRDALAGKRRTWLVTGSAGFIGSNLVGPEALARRLLGYEPTHTLSSGLREALPWYVRQFSAAAAVQ